MFSFRRSTPAPESSREGRRFPRQQRLTRGSELRAVARDGKRLRGMLLDVRVTKTTREHWRMGIIVPKHHQSAVRRNQLKRRLRELSRLQILGALRARVGRSGMDIVMRALPRAYRASFDELRAEVDALRPRLERLVTGPAARDRAGDTTRVSRA